MKAIDRALKITDAYITAEDYVRAIKQASTLEEMQNIRKRFDHPSVPFPVRSAVEKVWYKKYQEMYKNRNK